MDIVIRRSWHVSLINSLRELMKTYSAAVGEVEQRWYVVDAEGMVLGRLAAQIARIIRGKHKPTFTPHIDTGDNVIVINAAKVVVTGRKAEQKRYFKHSGYMGHEAFTPYAAVLARHPERVIESAVHGMLPKTTLSRTVLRKKSRVYPGTEHPHGAQKPEPLVVLKGGAR